MLLKSCAMPPAKVPMASSLLRLPQPRFEFVPVRFGLLPLGDVLKRAL